jgi:hypothetical protein
MRPGFVTKLSLGIIKTLGLTNVILGSDGYVFEILRHAGFTPTMQPFTNIVESITIASP